MQPIADPASFRDPSGRVYHSSGRILRTVTDRAAEHYEFVRDSGFLRTWIERGWVVRTTDVSHSELKLAADDVRYVLEHARIPFISYPYEWPFPALKAAALLHLDLQIEALAHDITLSDSSAYNIQFTGARPVFIDVLSFRRYRPGGYWRGYRQFCEQFLNPLLLRALIGVPYNAWYRGDLSGITAAALNMVLPAWRKLSWNVFSHVTLPARLEARTVARGLTPRPVRSRRPLPRSSYAGLLTQLREWIASLEPREQRRTTWSMYHAMHTYTGEERTAKRQFVSDFVQRTRPAMLWDFGCNAGDYSELALRSGADSVVGFDADHGALDLAFARSVSESLEFLPLFMDAANPSPDQGWQQLGRRGLAARGPADALLALAFSHHLAIGRNVPLDHILRWLTSLAPAGVVEFVPKADPTVQFMLASREDIFDGYDESAFEDALGRQARIVGSQTISATGRRLFIYDRS